MTDKNDDYYQPWNRDSAGGGNPQAPHHSHDDRQPDQGLAKPQDHAPPVGMDLSRYAEQEKGFRPPLIDADKVKQGSVKLWQKLRSTSSSFATWTIALGQKADIPARVQKLELPRRTKELARRSGVAAAGATRSAAEATRTAAEGTAKASKASAAKSKEIWDKMALADKVGKISSEAGRGLSDIADKTKTGIGQVAKVGKDSIGDISDKAGKLLPVAREEEEVSPPPSGLEQLLAREELAERKAAETKATAELPLFSDKAAQADAQDDMPQAGTSQGQDDRATLSSGAPAFPVDPQPSPAPWEGYPPVQPRIVQLAEPTPLNPVPEKLDDAVPAPDATPEPKPAIAPTHAAPAPTTATTAAAQPAQPTVAPTESASAPIPAASPSPISAEAPHVSPHKSAPTAHSPAAAPQPAAQPSPPPAFDTPKNKAERSVPAYQVVNGGGPADHSPRAMGNGFGGQSTSWMAVAAVALVALLGTSYWLGSRFGGGMSKADVETVVGDYITANPQIIPAALEAQRNREITKAINDVRPALEKPYAGAWGGNASGDVTLVVFTDYACGFCRASVPDIDRLIREDKRLKVVYRELPIIARESRSAALMALMAARQGKYDAFHHAMFAQSSLTPGAIMAAAGQAGVTLDGTGDATADEALFQRELENNLALGNQLQLNATPTWVIGDQLLQGQVGFEALREAITRARTKQSS